jgi:hypothetical protein
MNKDKHSLIVPKYFIMDPQFNNKGVAKHVKSTSLEMPFRL